MKAEFTRDFSVCQDRVGEELVLYSYARARKNCAGDGLVRIILLLFRFLTDFVDFPYNALITISKLPEQDEGKCAVERA